PTSASASPTEPPLPPSFGGTSSPGHPSVAISFQRSAAKPRGSRASSCTRSGGQRCCRKMRADCCSICCDGEKDRSIYELVGSGRRSSPRPPRRFGDSAYRSGIGLSADLGLGGQAERAHRDGRALDLGGAAGEGVAPARLVLVLDRAAEPC